MNPDTVAAVLAIFIVCPGLFILVAVAEWMGNRRK